MVKELEAWVIRWTTTMGLVPVRNIYRKDVRPRLTYRGNPVNSRIRNRIRMIAMTLILLRLPHLYNFWGPW